MSTPYTTGARPHWCGHFIEEHIYDAGRFICPGADNFPEPEIGRLIGCKTTTERRSS